MSWLGERALRITEQGPARCRSCARSMDVRQQAREVAGELGGGEATVVGEEPFSPAHAHPVSASVSIHPGPTALPRCQRSLNLHDTAYVDRHGRMGTTSKARERSCPPWVQIPPLPPRNQPKRWTREATPRADRLTSGSDRLRLPTSVRGEWAGAPV